MREVFVHQYASAYRNGVEDLLWRLPTMDRDLMSGGRASTDMRTLFARFWQVLHDGINPDLPGGFLGKEFRLDINYARMDWALYELRARNSHEGRRIFATSRGLIGTGPDLLKIGDQVCILYGAQIPFILCPVTGSNDRYEVVGEAWVHGIMWRVS
jgi:hypothetical protein